MQRTHPIISPPRYSKECHRLIGGLRGGRDVAEREAVGSATREAEMMQNIAEGSSEMKGGRQREG